MIAGQVTPNGEPMIELILDGRPWVAVIDTGFNGFLELPDVLRAALNPRYLFDTVSVLAAGQMLVEQVFEVIISFDGQSVIAEASFAPGQEVLVGTALLAGYELNINFKTGVVRIERVP